MVSNQSLAVANMAILDNPMTPRSIQSNVAELSVALRLMAKNQNFQGKQNLSMQGGYLFMDKAILRYE